MKRLDRTRKNFWLNVLDGVLYVMAMSVVPVQTILPAYLSRFTSNEYIINLIPAVSILGFALPQIIMARHVESRTHRKRMMLITGVFQRVPWLFLGLSVFLFPNAQDWVAIAVFFVLYSMHTFSTGVNLPVWMDLLAKLIPMDQRGKQFAYRNIGGGLLGLVGAALSKLVLKNVAFPQNYGILFLMFFFLTSISLFCLLFLDESASSEVKEKSGFREYIKRIPGLLSSDHNYRNFILARIILSLSGMAGGLVAIYGIDMFKLQGKEYVFADITFYSTLICIVPTFIFARIGDSYGHKANLLASPMIGIIAMVTLIFMKNEFMFALVFILQGLAMSALSVSNMNMVVEFCRDADRPTYISVMNTLVAPISFLAPMLGAFLARQIGYQQLFWIVIVLQVAYIIVLAASVRDPRRHGVGYNQLKMESEMV